MNDRQIAQICLIITITGMILLAATYNEEFEKKTINELINTPGGKGIISGRITFVIKHYPTTLFTLTDENQATIFYPQSTLLEKNDFVTVYAENQETSLVKSLSEKKLFAQKVVKQ